MDTAFRLSGDILPKHIASGILARIDRRTCCAMATSTLKRDHERTVRGRSTGPFDRPLDHGVHSHQPDRIALDDRQSAAAAGSMRPRNQNTRLSGKPVAALRQAMETWLPIAIVR